MSEDAVSLIRAWHDAVNGGDVERLGDLVTDDVEIGGPRGSANGRDLLIDWVQRTGIQMEPTDWYARGETFIVCQRATWPTDDGTPGVPQKVGSVYVVRNGRIERIARYSGLDEAFAATGLTNRDRIEV